MNNTIKHKIGLVLNDDTPETTLKRKVSFFIFLLILISSFEVILESVVSLSSKYHHYFFITDVVVSILFSIEYILRLWVYRIDGEKPTIKQRLSHIFSFYMLIDLISIIPFYFSIFYSSGYQFLRIIRILRLFRLMKFARYMKSQNLVVDAIKNKAKELVLSMQVVVFLTVILSAILYHIENSAQPENFGDIVDAFMWSLSKFIGDVGGYGDFVPITFGGQVIATIVGLLGIALFAVPAGIIGAGFVEEIEKIKEEEDIKEKNAKLLTAFNYENKASDIKNKKLIGLQNIRRRVINVTSAEFKLMLSRKDLITIADKGHGIKLSTLDGVELIQAFEENTNYGTYTNRDSKLTIISPTSVWQLYLGHFTYALSEYLKANYISSELVGKSAWDPKYKCALTISPNYISGEKSNNVYFEQFKSDMLDAVGKNSTVIYFLCSSSLNGSFHILNGGKKGSVNFTETESTYDDLSQLENFYSSFKGALEDFDTSEDSIYSTINKHTFYGNYKKDRFHWMLRKERNANIICIYLSPNILEAPANQYYPIIKILGDSIRENLF
ncbi:MAG: ion transporter [Saprospiraceae bacterium]|nr:ion transporter [Saprospiraceae bacterium]